MKKKKKKNFGLRRRPEEIKYDIQGVHYEIQLWFVKSQVWVCGS